jgi:hypothetical protein
MPANLTPAYRGAEAKFRSAVTREEKIACLEEMLRVIPACRSSSANRRRRAPLGETVTGSRGREPGKWCS